MYSLLTIWPWRTQCVNITLIWSKKVIAIHVCTDLVTLCLKGGSLPFLSQHFVACFIAGSWHYIHASSRVITLSNHISSSANLSRQILHTRTRLSFISCVNKRGTHRVHTHEKPNSFVNIICTLLYDTLSISGTCLMVSAGSSWITATAVLTSWTDWEGAPGPPCNTVLVRPRSNDSYHQYIDERDIMASWYVRRSRLNVWIHERPSHTQALMTYRCSRRSSSLPFSCTGSGTVTLTKTARITVSLSARVWNLSNIFVILYHILLSCRFSFIPVLPRAQQEKSQSLLICPPTSWKMSNYQKNCSRFKPGFQSSVSFFWQISSFRPCWDLKRNDVNWSSQYVRDSVPKTVSRTDYKGRLWYTFVFPVFPSSEEKKNLKRPKEGF